tara:strand:- start:15 stop:395 length:381 start_codon:yes stop_codon:yes gene_type:complete
MTILGLGVDVVEINRFKKIKNNKKIIKRIFTTYENRYCENKNKILCFAKRFAAKEAFVKALGTGFRDGINLSNIEIRNSKLGMPSIVISKFLKKKIIKKFKLKKFKVFLSISDEKNYAIANVIITK